MASGVRSRQPDKQRSKGGSKVPPENKGKPGTDTKGSSKVSPENKGKPGTDAKEKTKQENEVEGFVPGVFQLRHLLAIIIMFRWLNSFLVQTFYVPDEYWQSVEVAHKMVYGYGHLTWEWKKGLRGYTYPAMFAAVHKLLAVLKLDFGPVLVVTPRVMQATFSAFGDLFVYRFTRRLVGVHGAAWALMCQICSWFIFYTATRTLSNTMETILTTFALYYYPWPEAMLAKGQPKLLSHGTKLYLFYASLACIMRPTAGIVWLPLMLWHLFRTNNKVMTIIKDYIPIGLLALLWSMCIDRICYGKWVFVPYNFVHFNVFHDIGAFYGSHPFYWYLTQGVPVVMATHMVPFLLGVKVSWRRLKPLLILMAWIIAVYSCLSHKEFRFILPIMPLAICICGAFFQLVHGSSRATWTVAFLVVTNLPVALYTGMLHQRGTLDVTMHLQMSQLELDTKGPSVLFLMPCHSTPYYSHVHQNVTMRFLGCEPNLRNRSNYREEAETFYDAPGKWLQREYGSKTKQPSYLVFFNTLQPKIGGYLKRNVYEKVASFFHTHFPTERVGKHVYVFAKVNMPDMMGPEGGLHNGRIRGM
ncbi:GPI mannosyltransferase 3-like [Amphiura filiformis]|uniref:GPI mannosyltransferase 3-like n=1 Tax=Amphiura filiformis TaxID=82378 RepID=UPI003B219BA5